MLSVFAEVAKERAQNQGRKILKLAQYKPDPTRYALEIMGITPWAGCNGEKGQLELFQDIGDSVKRQLENDQTAPRIFRVEAGHGVGKTYGVAVLVNWFFDCFSPSITYTTAPSSDQVERLLWKDIKTQRAKRPDLPGRVYDGRAEMTRAFNHFAVGRAVNDAGGQGTARFQGQHGKHLFFVVDEAEGVPDFVYSAINAMMTGGQVVLAVFIGNPMTRTSSFHALRSKTGVMNYRFDVLNSPNVVSGIETVPNLSTRRWVDEMIDECCSVVQEHNDDEYTFTVPWRTDNGKPIIYKPDGTFLFRVRGIAPKTFGEAIIISSGAYEGAVARGKSRDWLPRVNTKAVFGIDVARYGTDIGTIYGEVDHIISRYARIAQQDSHAYLAALESTLTQLPPHVQTIEIRIDGSGGYGSALIDLLKLGVSALERFIKVDIIEVQFGSAATTPLADNSPRFADCITELYDSAANRLHKIGIATPNKELEIDLTARVFKFKSQSERETRFVVKKLMDKEEFKKEFGRSCDDGDGFVLCAADSSCFAVQKVSSKSLSDLFRVPRDFDNLHG